MKTKLFRILLLPLGLFQKMLDLSREGAKDIHYRLKYKDAIVDKGCSLCPETIIHQNSHIFHDTIINKSNINSYSYVGSHCLVQNTTIGKFCSIAKHSLIGLGIHPIDRFSTSPIFYRKKNPLKIELVTDETVLEEYKPIIIGHDVWVGARVTILDGVHIGTGAIIATGSVVNKDIPPYAIVGGVPARVIRYRFSDSVIHKLLDSKWWEWDLDKILSHKNDLL